MEYLLGLNFGNLLAQFAEKIVMLSKKNFPCLLEFILMPYIIRKKIECRWAIKAILAYFFIAMWIKKCLIFFLPLQTNLSNINEVSSCLSCDYTSARQHNLKKHVEKHIEGLSYSCNLCEKEFRKSDSLQHHKYIVHKTGSIFI